jgi:L-2-hydroxyglutarate oxidase LhgO
LTERVDCVVIGAGLVGLAVARALSAAGRDVLVLEAAGAIGTGISSRNSEVVHAGLYYPKDSLKAQLCVAGNRLLRAYAAQRGVGLSMVGKLIVATDADEEQRLAAILAAGHANGAHTLHAISVAEAQALEPDLRCTAALLSPDTGIIDSHALMLALLADAEAGGATLALRAPVIGGEGTRLEIGGADPMTLQANTVVIAAGLTSCAVAASLGLAAVPDAHLCKGNYFTLTGRMPFRRLVYPVPVAAGLGVHYTVDLAGRGRFGPDVEWVDHVDYAVDPGRAAAFAAAIRRYWPGLTPDRLEPGHAGIRPKITAPGDPAADFVIHGPAQHGQSGVVALYGIESPGLTACLALADLVKERVG